MNLWFRMLAVLIGSFFRPRLRLTDLSALGFRVMPHDLDINVHMNNARYMALMDLGRFDLVIRTGLWRRVLKDGWQAVIGGAVVRYRRPLRPFQRLVLSTRVLCWDEKWIYIEHRIDSGGIPACLTVVRGAFLKRGQIIPPSEVAAQLNFIEPAPVVPLWTAQWRALDNALDNQQPLSAVTGEENACVL